ENKNEVENSLFADFADEIKIEPPKILPAPEWPNMYKLNKEKEIIGFYLSAHPLDEFKFHYRFVQGILSKKEVLEIRKEEEIVPVETVLSTMKFSDDDANDEVIDMELSEGEEMPEEEPLKNVDAKVQVNFLNLDEIEIGRAHV